MRLSFAWDIITFTFISFLLCCILFDTPSTLYLLYAFLYSTYALGLPPPRYLNIIASTGTIGSIIIDLIYIEYKFLVVKNVQNFCKPQLVHQCTSTPPPPQGNIKVYAFNHDSKKSTHAAVVTCQHDTRFLLLSVDSLHVPHFSIVG